MTKDTKITLGIIALGLIGFAIVQSTKKDKTAPIVDPGFIDEPTVTLPVANDPIKTTTKINRDLVLRKGSLGKEVSELQKLLGVTVDGNFGPKTENALVATKGVKEISLNKFATTKTINPNPLKVGDRLMANKPTVTVYKNQMLANGNYYNTKVVDDQYDYGEEIGKIIAISADKLSYVVKDTDTFSPDIVWVLAADVIKI